MNYLQIDTENIIKGFISCPENELIHYKEAYPDFEFISTKLECFHFDSNFTYKTENNEIIKSERVDSNYLSSKRKLLIQELISKIEVIYNGKIYQGDESSQGRISKAINGLIDDSITTEWKAKDNSWNVVTRIDLQQILFLACNEQTRILKDN